MTMIFSPDALRAKTEKESQGRRTVIYSAKGQPNFMYQIYRDDLSAPHPAFCVNGQIIDAFFYACYPGSLHDGSLSVSPEKHRPVISICRNSACWHSKPDRDFISAVMRNGQH
ncbi:hypothetical protein [Morganella morganii]|uniref:hypothetical protein n=1 Tax=Morganella morganii TaxID=582 RepID=UPI00069B6BDC|nr:hypothetical protein [Morganella morganii]KNZ84404.1 hypothetical protein AKG16_18730 [Morganella morganii]MDF2405119.1 hypothetical protein [Morganella morganii]HCR4031813.1 hypothetical protein [Morganella morganii]